MYHGISGTQESIIEIQWYAVNYTMTSSVRGKNSSMSVVRSKLYQDFSSTQ